MARQNLRTREGSVSAEHLLRYARHVTSAGCRASSSRTCLVSASASSHLEVPVGDTLIETADVDTAPFRHICDEREQNVR